MINDEIKIKTGNIKYVCDILLNKKKGYHLELLKNSNVILFGDLDHIPNKETLNNIINEISNFFNIEIDDISLTLSKKIDDNELSCHWSFCQYYLSMENLKEVMKIFVSKYPEFKNYVDVSIYKKGWFRLPNQTNIDKNINIKLLMVQWMNL